MGDKYKMKYTCPCCGYKTLDEEPTDTYEICKICFWEDDETQIMKVEKIMFH